MRDLRGAGGLAAAVAGLVVLAHGHAFAQAQPPCYAAPSASYDAPSGTLMAQPGDPLDAPPGAAPWPPASTLAWGAGCAPAVPGASAATVIGQPGSLFLTAIQQRMSSGNAGSASPLGYASATSQPDGAFSALDRAIGGRSAGMVGKTPPDAPAPRADPDFIWVRGAGLYGNYDSINGAPGAQLSTGALFAGVEVPLDESLAIGLAGGWSDGSLDFDTDAGTLDTSAWHSALYASGAYGNWRGTGIITYDYYDLGSSRPVPAGTASADYAADHVEALAELSYVYVTGAALAFAPYASAGFSWVHVDGFSETGGGSADLTASAQDETWPYTLIGLRLSGAMNLGSALVSPSLDFGWRHVFGDTDPVLFYETEGAALSVAGMPIAENSLVVQAGFDAAFNSGWRTSLKYKGDIAHENQQHMLTGGVAVPF